MAWIDPDREAKFPFLTRELYEKSSEETPEFTYNCAAFVVGDLENWWQPPDEEDEDPEWFWPTGAPKDTRISSYVKAYQTLGFVLCDSDPEPDFDRIALYAYESGDFAHAALQLPDGRWKSKLGEWEDIEHKTLQALEGAEPAYGFAIHFMKRPIPK